jgi:hypothetical protein
MTTKQKMATDMTLRDAFAMKALLPAFEILKHDYTRDDPDWCWSPSIDNELLAALAYDLADAMLAEKKKKYQK